MLEVEVEPLLSVTGSGQIRSEAVAKHSRSQSNYNIGIPFPRAIHD